MAEQEKLINIFSEYDNTEPLSAGFSADELESLSKAMHSGDTDKAKEAESKVPKRIKTFVRLLNKLTENINAKLASKGFSYKGLKPLSVNNSITYNSSDVTGKYEIIENGENKHISFNVKSLLKYSALELSTIVSKSLITLIAKQNGKDNDKDFVEELLNDKTSESDNEKKLKQGQNIAKAREIIADYLKKFLPTVYADDFVAFDNISNYVANLIISDFDESQVEQVLGAFFDLETLGIDELATKEIDAILGKTHSSRVKYLTNRADQLAEDPEKEIIALGYEQQAQALLGGDSSDPNYLDLSKKFEQMNNGERCLSGSAVKEFCEYYVHNFLHSRNIKDIEVTFNPTGGLGTFHDEAETPSININLQKLRKIGSYTELAMTLSHELTHASDSAKNKIDGKMNRDGTGLLNSFDIDIEGVGATGDTRKLLVDIKSYCYHIDPNERHGRIGELSALLFMQKVGSKDANIQREIQESVARYVKYQQKTIDMIKSLPQKIGEFKNRLTALVDQGKISAGSYIYNMAMDNINYLEKNGLNSSVVEEIKSQEIARKIVEQKQQQNKIDEKAKKQAEEVFSEGGMQM